MILQELVRYYDRKSRDPDPAQRLPSFGLETKEIPFVVEISADGGVVQLRDTRQLVGKKLRAQSFLVPQGEKKTSGPGDIAHEVFDLVLLFLERATACHLGGQRCVGVHRRKDRPSLAVPVRPGGGEREALGAGRWYGECDVPIHAHGEPVEP